LIARDGVSTKGVAGYGARWAVVGAPSLVLEGEGRILLERTVDPDEPANGPVVTRDGRAVGDCIANDGPRCRVPLGPGALGEVRVDADLALREAHRVGARPHHALVLERPAGPASSE
jgi:hypothetical protein